MLLGGCNTEHNGDFRKERGNRRSIKSKTVHAWFERVIFLYQMAYPSFHVGFAPANNCRGRTGVSPELQKHWNPRGRLTGNSIQNMRGDHTHWLISFLKRSRVISRCCSAAI